MNKWAEIKLSYYDYVYVLELTDRQCFILSAYKPLQWQNKNVGSEGTALEAMLD